MFSTHYADVAYVNCVLVLVITTSIFYLWQLGLYNSGFVHLLREQFLRFCDQQYPPPSPLPLHHVRFYLICTKRYFNLLRNLWTAQCRLLLSKQNFTGTICAMAWLPTSLPVSSLFTGTIVVYYLRLTTMP